MLETTPKGLVCLRQAWLLDCTEAGEAGLQEGRRSTPRAFASLSLQTTRAGSPPPLMLMRALAEAEEAARAWVAQFGVRTSARRRFRQLETLRS